MGTLWKLNYLLLPRRGRGFTVNQCYLIRVRILFTKMYSKILPPTLDNTCARDPCLDSFEPCPWVSCPIFRRSTHVEAFRCFLLRGIFGGLISVCPIALFMELRCFLLAGSFGGILGFPASTLFLISNSLQNIGGDFIRRWFLGASGVDPSISESLALKESEARVELGAEHDLWASLGFGFTFLPSG